MALALAFLFSLSTHALATCARDQINKYLAAFFGIENANRHPLQIFHRDP